MPWIGQPARAIKVRPARTLADKSGQVFDGRHQFVLPRVDHVRAEMQRKPKQLGQSVPRKSLAVTARPGLQVGKKALRTAKPEKRKGTGKINGEKR
jgi:hypothetical protein